jgi:molybdate transport system substrate-binding protein
MKNALDDINVAFTKSTGIKVAASYAASSALMKQIEQGAPADVFASADLDRMDYGRKRSSMTRRASTCWVTNLC